MRYVLVVCLIASMANACLAEKRRDRPSRSRRKILCNGKCQIEGLLGKPDGRHLQDPWRVGEGDDFAKMLPPFSLRITEIDGKKLPPECQVVIDRNCVKWLRDRKRGQRSVPGEKVEGRVYESGGGYVSDCRP